MNRHFVCVEHTTHYRYEVELDGSESAFMQANEAKQIARGRFDAGDRPAPRLVRDTTSWDFASSPRKETE